MVKTKKAKAAVVEDSDEVKAAKAKYRKALWEGHNPAIPWGNVLTPEQRKEVETE